MRQPEDMPHDPTTPALPVLFDRTAHAHALRRAASYPPARFLLERAAEDLADRLAATLRPFPDAIDWCSPADDFATVLHGAGRHVITARPPGLEAQAADIISEPDHLPFAAQSADLIVSAYALQSIDDLPGALVQIRRVLRPDGLFMACLLGGRSLTELRDVLTAAEVEVSGGVSPRVYPFADVRDLGGLMQRAGFALPVTDIDTVTVRYADLFALLRDVRAMGATNILSARPRHFTRRTIFLRAAQLYAERYSDPDGRIRATFETIWISGWAPHESQQKPLRPGSAKARLADALKVPEQPI
jgi:SAM-dependent methyltransferase